MQNQIPPEVYQRLDALAAKLGTTVQYLWSVVLRQARVEIIQDLCLAIVFFLAIGLLSYVLKKLVKYIKDDAAGWNDEWSFIAAGLCIFGIVGSFAWLVIMLYSVITPLLNPEYWALQQVLNALK